MKTHTLFTWQNIPVQIHPSFWLILGIVTLSSLMSTATNMFEQLIWSLLFFFGLVVFIFLHELGHVWAAKKVGIRCERIVLHIFGQAALLEKLPETPRHSAFVTISGPLVNLVLATFFLGSLFLTAHENTGQLTDIITFDTTLQRVLSGALILNVLLFLFNLVPIYPLDGGRMVHAGVWALFPKLKENGALGVTLIIGLLCTVPAVVVAAINGWIFAAIIVVLANAMAYTEWKHNRTPKEHLRPKTHPPLTNRADP